MTAEEKLSLPSRKPLSLYPLLVALGALLLYGITLQHWVTISSLPVVSKITGWDWHPIPTDYRQTPSAPLYFLLTLPVRILPVTWQPLALNVFAAICGSLTLGLLAASVRLLPHDRTREQRQREGGEFALLSISAAWMPVLFAVLMLAFQLSFWRGATATGGEMLDLLVFATLIYSLLKFRISQDDRCLFGFAFLYGLGTSNNWALLGYFPFFFIALAWIKGANFFNARFLVRMAGCGILGLLLYLIIPAVGSLSGDRANFFSLLHLELGAQSFGLRSVPRWIAAVAALPTLLPLVFAGIKWPSFEGEISAAGSSVTRLMFRLLHVVFLLLALVMYTDLKFSPSLRLQEEVPSVAFLTFFYMGALCIGYYTGYILLVFGKNAGQSWDKRRPLTGIFNLVVAGLAWLLAVAAPAAQVYRNISHISASHSGALKNYARELVQDLPSKQVLVLSDDPERLFLLQAELAREGKPNNYILIETSSLPYRDYVAYLVTRYPDLKKLMPPPERLPRVMGSDVLMRIMVVLSRKYTIYYLHPSFGYYFEIFHLQPHGLVYSLEPYAKDALEEPPLSNEVVKENEAIWSRLQKSTLAALPTTPKMDPDVDYVSDYYSVALDDWAVPLQKANLLREANARFSEAIKVNPQNFIAKINREYNERLQKQDHRPIDTGDLFFRALMAYHSLVPILKLNGVVDEPGLDKDFGRVLAEGKDFRQAAILFQRRLQLLPGDPVAELDLSKTFVDWGQPDKALEMVAKLRANPAANEWEVSRVEALAYLTKGDLTTAEKLLLKAFNKDNANVGKVAIVAEFYRAAAYQALKEKKPELAAARFTNSLNYLDLQIKLLAEANQNQSEPVGMADTMLKKAEVQMMLKQFEPSILTLNKLLQLQPRNAIAILNLAIAKSQVAKYDDAISDYKMLRRLFPRQTYLSDFGMADIAARQKKPDEEIRWLKHYLNSAPDDAPEFQQVKQRLKHLENP